MGKQFNVRKTSLKSSALIISLTEPKDQLELTVNNQMLRFCLDIMDATKSKEEMNHPASYQRTDETQRP